jgi:uncharacterized protein YdeI (YjbR/CyaY-like superfamily)
MKTEKKVESYIESKKEWSEALFLLRELMASTPMKESVKWGMPVYTLNGKNVAGFSSFKSFISIWFYQGVFLKDTAGKLINAQEGITRGLRQWRFSSVQEIRENRETILQYLEESVQNHKEGLEIRPERHKDVQIHPELEEMLSRDPELGKAFGKLTLSNQREYIEYIFQAKRPETRQGRIEKIIPLIRKGVGLNDRYKK